MQQRLTLELCRCRMTRGALSREHPADPEGTLQPVWSIPAQTSPSSAASWPGARLPLDAPGAGRLGRRHRARSNMRRRHPRWAGLPIRQQFTTPVDHLRRRGRHLRTLGELLEVDAGAARHRSHRVRVSIGGQAGVESLRQAHAIQTQHGGDRAVRSRRLAARPPPGITRTHGGGTLSSKVGRLVLPGTYC